MLPVLATPPRTIERLPAPPVAERAGQAGHTGQAGPASGPSLASRPGPALHAVVGALVAVAAVAALIAAVTGHGELAVYLVGLGVVTTVGWAASVMERWTVTPLSVSRRRPLFTTTIALDDVRTVSVIDNDGVTEIVVGGRGWRAVEIPVDEERTGPGTVKALAALVEAAAHRGAQVDPAALQALSSAR